MKQIILTLALLFLTLLPATAAKKIEANPINIAATLVEKTDSAKVTLAVLIVQAQALQGKKIEEIAEKLLFDLPQIEEDDLSFISLTELRYEYFKAKNDIDNAEKWRVRFEELKQEYLT